MDQQLPFHVGLPEARFLRLNGPSLKSASRTNAEPEKKLHKHRGHRHQDSHDERHNLGRRHAAKEALRSAIEIEPPTSFGDLLKGRVSKEISPDRSRRGYANGRDDGSLKAKDGGDVGITIPPYRPLRAEDVDLEAKRVKTREKEVRAALESLSDQSIKTSRRLDDTYYSILEKVSTLRQTVGTLQELSDLTRELHDNFDSDNKELVDDITGQLENLDNLQAQQRRIESLEKRIELGRTKATALEARLAASKKRVEERAISEADWEASHIRCVRVFWTISGFIVAIIIAVVFVHGFRSARVVGSFELMSDPASISRILNAPIPDIAKEAIKQSTTGRTIEHLETSSARPLLVDDERLRIFDEL